MLSAGLVAYTTVGVDQVAVGTYDVIADGNGGSSNGNYSYTAAGIYQLGGFGLWYTLDGLGGSSYASGVITELGNTYYFPGDGTRFQFYPIDGSPYFASSPTVTIGTTLYQSDGNWIVDTYISSGDLLYYTNDVGAVINIVDTDPYN